MNKNEIKEYYSGMGIDEIKEYYVELWKETFKELNELTEFIHNLD